MNYKGEVRQSDARNEVMHAYSDHSKAIKVFEIKEGTFTSLKDGVEKMAVWAVKAGARESNTFSNIEILEKLPPVWLEKK